MWYYMIKNSQNELYHHGIKGQKWGVRRYRNKDGSLTNALARRYSDAKSAYRNAKAERRYTKDMKNYQMAKTLKMLSRDISNIYNRPGVNSIVRANQSAKAAQYSRKADKLIKSISKESMSRMKSEERKASIERAKRFEEEREIFRRHMDSIIEEAKKGNTARHPGL